MTISKARHGNAASEYTGDTVGPRHGAETKKKATKKKARNRMEPESTNEPEPTPEPEENGEG